MAHAMNRAQLGIFELDEAIKVWRKLWQQKEAGRVDRQVDSILLVARRIRKAAEMIEGGIMEAANGEPSA